MADWLARSYTSTPLLYWLMGSILLYALGTNLLRWLKAMDLDPAAYVSWLAQIGRFLFFLGIPYLALGGWPRRPFQGLLSLEDLGLVAINTHWPATRWLSAAGTAIALGLGAFLLLALAWNNAQRRAGANRLRFPPRAWWMLLLDGLYLQAHWAFYRTALAITLGDVYAGVFLGLGLIYLEWALNPTWRQDWRSPSRAGGRWLGAALALVAALIFLFTRNLWLCLGMHLLLGFALRAMNPRPAAAPAADQML